MYLPLLTPLINVIGSLGGSWLKKQIIIAEGSIDIAKSRAQAQAQVQLTRAQAEIEWERAMAQASGNSWKDELWTIFFVTILFFSFIPGMEYYIKQGFENIASLPDWFGYAVMLAISAAFGKNIVKDFTSLKTGARNSTTSTNTSSRKINMRD